MPQCPWNLPVTLTLRSVLLSADIANDSLRVRNTNRASAMVVAALWMSLETSPLAGIAQR
jgi:hypothetical protein